MNPLDPGRAVARYVHKLQPAYVASIFTRKKAAMVVAAQDEFEYYEALELDVRAVLGDELNPLNPVTVHQVPIFLSFAREYARRFRWCPGGGAAFDMLTQLEERYHAFGLDYYALGRVAEMIGNPGWVAPGAFDMDTPLNHAIDQAVSGNLVSEPSADADTYVFQIRKTGVPIWTTIGWIGAPTKTCPYSGLSAGTAYQWRVYALHRSTHTGATTAFFDFITAV